MEGKKEAGTEREREIIEGEAETGIETERERLLIMSAPA